MKTNRIVRGVLLVLAVLVWTGACRAGDAPATVPSSALKDFIARVEVAKAQLPTIIKAAEAAATRKLAHPEALLDVTYGLQPSFAEELLNRSGGLAEALPTEERSQQVTDNDIVVFSIRSWEADGEKGLAYLRDCHKKGWMIILFASSIGRPADLQVDWFIDNGARSATESDAAVNSAANALNGWLWVCEYAAALTRHGKYPGILQSITTAGAAGHDQPLQKPGARNLNLYDCPAAVPAGDLAHIYLQRVARLIEDLSGPTTQGQINGAATIIAGRLKEGRKVFVSTDTHIMLGEMDKDIKTPWTPLFTLRNMGDVLTKSTKPGDLFFWLGFNGVSIWSYADDTGPATPYIDYDTPLRASKVDFITCFAHDPLHPANNGQGALAHIEQNWSFGDSEVPVPFPPGRMGPISGLCQSMLYRMLDDAASAKLR